MNKSVYPNDLDLPKEIIMIIKDFLWGNIKTQKKNLI